MQETVKAEKCCTNIDISKLNNRTKPMANSRLTDKTEYFLSQLIYDSNKTGSTETRQQLHNDFADVFNEIGCFSGTFSLHLKQDSKPYQANPKMCGI